MTLSIVPLSPEEGLILIDGRSRLDVTVFCGPKSSENLSLVPYEKVSDRKGNITGHPPPSRFGTVHVWDR